MKKIINYTCSLLILLISFASGTMSQDLSKEEKKNRKAEAIRNLVESKRFIFEARSVSPSGAATRQLTSYYDISVKGDTVVSFLPYFGRAYAPPVNSSDAGIRFTSNDFAYEVSPRRRGGWDVLIKPNNVAAAQLMNLSISESGQASLHVTSNNRQPISFMGTIKENRK